MHYLGFPWFFDRVIYGCVFFWGGIPAPVFSEVFLSSVGRLDVRLLCGTLIGAGVGLWCAVWGVSASWPCSPRWFAHPFQGLCLCVHVLL
jgi:hypothetical protein